MNIKLKSWGIVLVFLALLAGSYLGYLRFQPPKAALVEERAVALEEGEKHGG